MWKSELFKDVDPINCCICCDVIGLDKDVSIRLACGHVYHYNCFTSLGRALCPMCRQVIDVSVAIHRIKFENVPLVPPVLQRQHGLEAFDNLLLNALIETIPANAPFNQTLWDNNGNFIPPIPEDTPLTPSNSHRRTQPRTPRRERRIRGRRNQNEIINLINEE